MNPSSPLLATALGALSLTASAGTTISTGASETLFPDLPKALADYDADGRLDALTLSPDGTPRLLHNLGAAGFEDATDAAGLTAIGAARGATWHDIDGDGHVDLTLFTPEGGVRVLYNSTDGLFAEGTEGSGLELAQGVVAARWTDLDGDGLSELWAADDQGEHLWRNLGDGTFSELSLPGPEAGGGSKSMSGPGGYSINPAPGNPLGTVCLPRIEDQTGGCLEASSVPTPGRLFTFTTSTIPGLSADKLDGLDSSTFTQLGQTIEGSEISAGTIGSTNLAPDSVNSSHVILNSLTGFDIQDGSVTKKELAADSVEAMHIATDAVGSTEIATSAVGAAEIAAGAVGTTEIAPNAINSNHIQLGAINSTDIQDGQVGASDLALFSITNANISGSAGISGSKIVSHFGAQDLTTDNRLGVGTVLPLEDLHVVGSPTMGTVLITPDEPVGGDDAELILGETDVGDYGMRMSYDGGTNTMSLGGVFNGVNTPHWKLTRDSGRMGIGIDPITDTRLYIDDDNRWGVRVLANSTTSGITYGVSAVNSGTQGVGIFGQAIAATGTGTGVHGETSAPLGFGITCAGTFLVTGVKLFTQPHPTDSGKEVRFVCLEGNESGTYFRGSSKLVGGEAIIDVPEDFRLVTEADGMTVQVTAVGLPAALYVVSRDLNRIVVRGNVDVDFDYFVNGVRRGYADFETMAENRFFVPTERGVPFGTQYPDAVRQILVDNGTLNPDFTPNEATAAARGWVLQDPAPAGPVQVQEAPVN